MKVFISMLRGINVGGHNKIKMEELRALYESLGLSQAQTHIQSGNVLFKTKEPDPKKLAKLIGDAIERKFKFRPALIVRTSSELREVINRNPFAARKGIDPAKLLITFLSDEPAASAREKTLKLNIKPEELHIEGREMFVYFPNGMARPKFSWSLVEKHLNVSGTGRNLNTVQKLLEMAEALESKT
jgi:uncharacterized protein (DUF1697 family)